MYKSFLSAMVIALALVTTHAQQTLPETVVTASKYPEKQSQSGKVITVLTDSLLRANAGLSVGQILNQQVGLQVIGSGQNLGSVQNIAMRGAGFGLTLILLDGIPVNDASGIGNTFDINLLNTNTIDRIEILKGGQSTIYGSDAVAGVINIITKKSTQKPTQLAASVSYGSFNTAMINANMFGTLNKTSYEVSLGHAKSGGFSSATEPDNYIGKFGNNPYSNTNFSAKITQQINNKTSIYGLLKNNNYRTNLDYGAFLDETDYVSKTQNSQIGVGLFHELRKGNFHLNYLHNATERSYLDDSTYINPKSYNKYSNTNYKSIADYFESYINIKLSNNTRLLAGADFRLQNMKYNYFSIDNYGRFDDSPLNASINNGSIYASISQLPTQKFGFEIGSRLNYHSTYNFNATYSLNPYYLINEHVKVFGTLSTSYRNPALYNLYSPYGNTNLKPETATTFELGSQIFEGTNNVRLVFFKRNLSNVIFFQSSPKPPYGQYINQDKQQDFGLEIDGNYKISKITLNANYTYLSGKTSTIINGKDSTINDLLRKPKHTFNININCQITDKLNIAVGLQHLTARSDSYYNSDTYKTEKVTLAAYTIVNANLNFKISKNINGFVNAQNLTNTQYAEIYGYKSRPFSFQAGFNINL